MVDEILSEQGKIRSAVEFWDGRTTERAVGIHGRNRIEAQSHEVGICQNPTLCGRAFAAQ
jgi:hypothetical protein